MFKGCKNLKKVKFASHNYLLKADVTGMFEDCEDVEH